MKDSFVGLMLVKSDSKRLANKNTLDFNGVPMFVVNLRKCLQVFPETYVSSDSDEILNTAWKEGAKIIKRGTELCGDTPNIPVYQHALKYMDQPKGIVAVQANSPTVALQTIELVRDALESGAEEAMTIHDDGSIYGSVWGMTTNRLLNYGDPYNPNPDVRVVDHSTDIHTQEDYENTIQHK